MVVRAWAGPNQVWGQGRAGGESGTLISLGSQRISPGQGSDAGLNKRRGSCGVRAHGSKARPGRARDETRPDGGS